MAGSGTGSSSSLMEVIMGTFHNRSSADVKQAEEMLLSKFGDPTFIEQLSWLLKDPQQPHSTRMDIQTSSWRLPTCSASTARTTRSWRSTTPPSSSFCTD